MHWTQWLYLGLLLAASIAGIKNRWAVGVLWLNVAFTMTLAPSPIAVGIADMVCAAALVGKSRTNNTIAALFAVMIPVYIAAKLFSWHNSTTYTLIDLLAYLQLGVLSSGAFGIRGRSGPNRHRHHSIASFAGLRAYIQGRMARGNKLDEAS